MTSVRYRDDRLTLHHGDCVEVLATLPDASVDSVVTDPPYELGFMGRRWDASGIAYNVELWKQCLRVLKPGGHLLAFGGTRTYHRMTCAIEDAGFEIRDEIAWLYGSGFPKSLDVSKAIDKAGGNPLSFRIFARAYGRAIESSTLTHADVDRHLNIKASSYYWAREDHRGGLPPRHHWDRVRDLLGLDADLEQFYDEAEREIIGTRSTGIGTGRGDVSFIGDSENRDVTAPATDDAKRWDGWGTALKPAHEPVVVARKPLVGTVAANVTAHGTGALNIDACRVEHASDVDLATSLAKNPGRADLVTSDTYGSDRPQQSVNTTGRWPTNVVLDDAAAQAIDEQSDGVSRFFPVFRYQAKAPSKERPKVDGVAHPTVKPLELMRWLVRLVTPPDGVVLDPFAGSGTTAQAALIEDFRCITIEREAAYLPLIATRLGITLTELVEDRSAWTPDQWIAHFAMVTSP